MSIVDKNDFRCINITNAFYPETYTLDVIEYANANKNGDCELKYIIPKFLDGWKDDKEKKIMCVCLGNPYRAKIIAFVCYQTTYSKVENKIIFVIWAAYTQNHYRRMGCLKMMIESIRNELKQKDKDIQVISREIRVNCLEESKEIWEKLGFVQDNITMAKDQGDYIWVQSIN